MKLDSPYVWLASNWQLVICIFLSIAALAVGNYLQKQGAELDRLLPYGVLDIETPWSPQRADAIISRLGADGIALARRHTQIDFLFLFLYPFAISIACALIAVHLPGRLSAFGILISWAVLLAGPLDAIENICMLRLLSGSVEPLWLRISTICASVKFTLVFGGLGFMIAGLTMSIARYLKG